MMMISLRKKMSHNLEGFAQAHVTDASMVVAPLVVTGKPISSNKSGLSGDKYIKAVGEKYSCSDLREILSTKAPGLS